MKPIEMYASKGFYQDSFLNTFAEDYIHIFDVAQANNDPKYRFLKKITAPKNHSYLYMVYDYNKNITKLGQSFSPYSRICQHISCFVSYAGSSTDCIESIWSKKSFHLDLNIEKQMLNEFRSRFPNTKQIASEFFMGCSFEDSQEFFIDFIKQSKHLYSI